MTILQNCILIPSMLKLYIIVGLVFGVSTTVITDKDAKVFLKQFGYLEVISNGPISDIIFRESIEKYQEGLRRFQSFSSLKITGNLDYETLAEMNMPRCGVLDVLPNYDTKQNGRPERFSFTGRRWNDNHLSYRVTKYSNKIENLLKRRIIDEDINRAMKAWSNISTLKFENQMFGDVDIKFSFERMEHGDGSPFDGKLGVLAHAFGPRVGDVHYDDDDTFNIGNSVSKKGVSFFAVTLHEVGHSLGLGHSEVKGAVMYPTYQTSKKYDIFHDDDKKAIQKLYGDAK